MLIEITKANRTGTELLHQNGNGMQAPRVGLLTGGFDRPYALGIAMEIVRNGYQVDVMGGAEVDTPEMHSTPGIRFFDCYGDPRTTVSGLGRIGRILGFYVFLLRYIVTGGCDIIHILWNYKFPLFDRTILMLLFRVCGKKPVLTAHNVNTAERDGCDSLLNRTTLKIQYRLARQIFVHTAKMRDALITDYGVETSAVSVIPFGINNSVLDSKMSCAEAKAELGIAADEKAILFFGAIRPYKGLAALVAAFEKLVAKDPTYRLIIAGEPKKDTGDHLSKILQVIEHPHLKSRVLARMEFIPDEQTELYFKAADLLVLSYTMIFQSGVLFLGYNFGLPTVATDVGSFNEDIIEGETGYLAKAGDVDDLARTIDKYFSSDLYSHLASRRVHIQEFARERYSWEGVGRVTKGVYERLTAEVRPQEP